MSLGDILFGESPSVSTQTLPTLTPEQSASLESLLKALGGGTGINAPSYGGDFVAPLTSTESLSLAGLENMASGLSETGLSELGQTAEDVLQQFLTGETINFDEFFATNVQDPLLQSFSEEILPGISRGFQGANFFSSDRATADQRAQDELLSSLTRSRESLALNFEQLRQGNALQALGLTPAIQQGNLSSIAGIMELGALPRELEQFGLNQEYADFIRQQDERDRRIRELLAAINTSAFENVVTVSGGSEGIGGDLAMAAAVAFASSKTYKNEIGEVSILDKLVSVPVKMWRYKPAMGLGGELHIGPYAEDFRDAFKVGDGKTINLIDFLGVLLGAVKELSERVAALSKV